MIPVRCPQIFRTSSGDHIDVLMFECASDECDEERQFSLKVHGGSEEYETGHEAQSRTAAHTVTATENDCTAKSVVAYKADRERSFSIPRNQ